MAQKASDFVQVQLTDAGAKLGAVTVSNAHMSYRFTAGQPVRVLTSEWRRVLSRERLKGEALFEIAPDAPAPAKAMPVLAAIQPPAPAAQTSSETQMGKGK